MSECPFCTRDPFHYVDNGCGMEAVAVACCELGDLYFRGARKAPEEVTLSYKEFDEIGGKLARLIWLSKQMDEINSELGIEDDREDAAYGIREMKRKLAEAPVAWMNSEHVEKYRHGNADGIAWASPQRTDFYTVALCVATPALPPHELSPTK